MRARSKHEHWSDLTDTSLPWLAQLDPELDLIASDEQTWRMERAEQHVAAALAATISVGRGPSVATKMLHLKRPRLFPILDNLGAQALATAPFSAKPAVEQAALAARLLTHLRQQGRNNLKALQEIQTALRSESVERSLVRILDVSIWSSHPAAATKSKRVFTITLS